MQNIIIDDKFWDIFPDAQINILIVNDIDNHDQNEDYVKMLNDAQIAAKQYITRDVFSENEIIQNWRKIYQSFKKKKGARSSIEALLKRVSQKKEIGHINPLVDVYNSISLRYGVPIGGEDIDTIQGPLHLGIANGNEAFFPLGDSQNEPALNGEVIYYDDAGAVCRCLNWRDGQRTMLKNDTTNAIFFIESINKDQLKQSNEAIASLREMMYKIFGVTGEIYKLTKNNSQVTINL